MDGLGWCAFQLIVVFGLCGCGGAGGNSELAIPIAPPVTLLAVGDIAQCTAAADPQQSAAGKTAQLVSTLSQDAPILSLGDNVYFSGTASEFAGCYQSTWGKFLQRTWATPGNHDYGVAQASGYFDYFGARAGPDRRGFYAVNIGNWKILSLNSIAPAGVNSEQMLWLRAELAKSPVTCTLAAWHYPRFSSSGVHGSMTEMREIWRTLQEAKVDVVLAGHDHLYERFARLDADGVLDANGIRSFVVGTGGAALYPFKSPVVTGSEARVENAFGVLRMTLHEDRYAWEFIDTAGAVRDAGSDSCRI